MTTNSPNPVDGDVQALIVICKKKISQITKEASEGLSKHKVQEMLIYSHALASLTTPPAQLLRPVELPKSLRYMEIPAEYLSYPEEIAHQRGFSHALKRVAEALRHQGYEVKND